MAKRSSSATGRALEELAALADVAPDALEVTEDLVRQCATLGLAQLVFAARRGCHQSAKYLVDRHLGEPTPSEATRISQMAPEAVRLQLIDDFVRGGVDREQAERIIDGAVEADDEASSASV